MRNLVRQVLHRSVGARASSLATLSSRLCSLASSRRFASSIICGTGPRGRRALSTVATSLRELDGRNRTREHLPLERGWFPDKVEGPMYRHDANKIEILDSATDFYDTILSQVRTSEKQITLSTLYLGDGTKSRALVDTLCERMAAVPALQVHILLDGHRGTRLMDSGDSSLSLLSPLLKQAKDRVHVTLSQSPPSSALLPPRVNEVPFVYHIKGFLFDDNLLMSGANLSDDYFTNRVDRYWLFRDAPSLTSCYRDLFAICRDMGHHAMYQDDVDSEIGHHSAYHGVTVVDNVEYDALTAEYVYLEAYRCKLDAFLRNHHDDSLANHHTTIQESCDENDVFILPTLQYARAHIIYDTHLITSMLRSWGSDVRVHICTAYFNLAPALAESVVSHTGAHVSILAASPQANGFLNSSGMSGYIPAMYRDRLHRFIQYAKGHLDAADRIQVSEWHGEGEGDNTFHAKGMWAWESVVGQRDDHDPRNRLVTTIGSPNFGRRSAERDIESQLVVLVPASSPLGKAARAECRTIWQGARAVPSDPLAGTGVSQRGVVKSLASLMSSYL